MNSMRKNISIFLRFTRLVSLSILLLFGFATQAGEKAKPYLGEDWTLNNLKGEKIQLSKFQGQPVILVFWATWCPYCKKLLPGMQKLHEKYADKGLKIIAVNIKEDWKPHVYWRNHEYTFDAALEGDEVAKIYGVRGTPSIVFIEPSGKVLPVKQFSDPNHPILEKFASHYLSSSDRE